MRIAAQTYLILLLLALARETAFSQEADYHLFFEQGYLHVKVGQYEMRFWEKPSWTFRDVYFDGKKWQQDTGWLQPVLRETNTPETMKDAFLGTGHRPEQVDQVKIIVQATGRDPRQFKITEDIDLKGRAHAVSIVKQSRFISAAGGFFYDHQSEVTLTAEGQREKYFFKAADGDLDKVQLLYAFMHIWPKTATQWVVGDDQGQVIDEGTFRSDGSFSCDKSFRWALIYEPQAGLGTVYVYPEMSPGRNKFWNRSYDRKLYLTVDPPRKAGQESTYFVRLEAYSATKENWQNKGRMLLAKHIPAFKKQKTENATP